MGLVSVLQYSNTPITQWVQLQYSITPTLQFSSIPILQYTNNLLGVRLRKNKNRGYQKLRVWDDAIKYYAETCRVFRGFPYELNRVARQAIASSDSVHRNIAEGYCRRSINEYLNFLNIALGSLGESISGLYAYRKADQISEEDFEKLDNIGYKLENELLKLVESLEKKREQGDWIDTLIVKESNAIYGAH
jgi:four helix bundle protein